MTANKDRSPETIADRIIIAIAVLVIALIALGVIR